MKKLVAAVLTGVLVAGTLSTGVYAKDDDKTITVAASATPHAEILEEAKPLLEKEGYELEVTVFDDYVRPNEVVESGEFDANYFQHILLSQELALLLQGFLRGVLQTLQL